jgi:hypothetical protein
MKTIKKYISEGLFDNDRVNNISNSLSRNFIKGTFKINDKTKPVSIYGSYRNKDIVQIFINNHDITEIVINEDNPGFEITSEYLERELGISINNKLVVTYCFPDDLYTIEKLFFDCSNLIGVDLSHLDISKLKYCDETFCYTPIKEIKFPKGVNNEEISFDGIFLNCESLETVDMSESVFNEIHYARNMFSGCEKLKIIKIDGLCTKDSKATCEDYSGMFYDCKSIEKIDLTGLKMEYSQFMGLMFAGCKKLKEVILPYIAPDHKCDNIFAQCKNLKTVDISGYYNNSNVDNNTYESTMRHLKSKYSNIHFIK